MNLLSLVSPRLDNICQIRRKWYYSSGSFFLQSKRENYENLHRLHKKKEVDLRDIMQEARTPPHNGYLAAASTSKCWNRKWLCPLGRNPKPDRFVVACASLSPNTNDRAVGRPRNAIMSNGAEEVKVGCIEMVTDRYRWPGNSYSPSTLIV